MFREIEDVFIKADLQELAMILDELYWDIKKQWTVEKNIAQGLPGLINRRMMVGFCVMFSYGFNCFLLPAAAPGG